MRRKQFKYEEKHISYLKKIANGNSHKKITELFNMKFNTNLPYTTIKAALQRNNIRNNIDSKFKKGITAWNKGKKTGGGPAHTLFKKGNKPANYKELGSERENTKDGYTLIKTAEPNVWRHKHVVIWEQENGKVPDGHVVMFGDGDNSNFDINNLICISKKQLLGLNRNKLIKNDAELTKLGVKVVDLKYAINDRRKNE